MIFQTFTNIQMCKTMLLVCYIKIDNVIFKDLYTIFLIHKVS